MTPRSHTAEPAGGDALLTLIAGALIVVVGIEAAFMAHAGWWLLPLAMLTVIGAAAGVMYALVRVMDGETPIPTPPASAAPAPAGR